MNVLLGRKVVYGFPERKIGIVKGVVNNREFLIDQDEPDDTLILLGG